MSSFFAARIKNVCVKFDYSVSTQQLQQQQQQRTKSILKPGETVPGSIPGNGGPGDNTDSKSQLEREFRVCQAHHPSLGLKKNLIFTTDHGVIL